MNESSLAVRKIFEESNGFSKVSINNEVFKAIAGFSPSVPYTTSRSADGKGVRKYNIEGVTVFTKFNQESKKTSIIMRTEDAQKYLRTLDEERIGGETLPFAFA